MTPLGPIHIIHNIDIDQKHERHERFSLRERQTNKSTNNGLELQ